jgi:hypothetical protein
MMTNILSATRLQNQENSALLPLARRVQITATIIMVPTFGLICLFVFTFYRNDARNQWIGGNMRINVTGALLSCILFYWIITISGLITRSLPMPDPIDNETPKGAFTWTRYDRIGYERVFPHWFNNPGYDFPPSYSWYIWVIIFNDRRRPLTPFFLSIILDDDHG